MKKLLSLGACFLPLAAAPAWACPACKEFVSSASDPNAFSGLSHGFAWSIGLLLSVPYLLVGGFSLFIMLAVRRTRKQ